MNHRVYTKHIILQKFRKH